MAARDLIFYIKKIFYLLLRFVTAIPLDFWHYSRIINAFKFAKDADYQREYLDIEKVKLWYERRFPNPLFKKYNKIFFKTVILKKWILSIIDWLSYISIEMFILFHFHFHLSGISNWLFWILLFSLVGNIQGTLKDIKNNE